MPVKTPRFLPILSFLSFSIIASLSLLPTLSRADSVPYNPPNRGAPGESSTADAGSRGCGLVALEPAQTHWGETLQAQPSFWLYATGPGTVELVLSEESTNTVIYRGSFAATHGAGIGQYSLADTAAVLEVDQIYRWQFSLDCPGNPDPVVTGIVVRRAAPEALQSALESASPREQIDLLAASGLWYDTLTTLATLRQANPNSPELATAWVDLLSHDAVGLDQRLGTAFEPVATAPLIDCCSPSFPPKR